MAGKNPFANMKKGKDADMKDDKKGGKKMAPPFGKKAKKKK